MKEKKMGLGMPILATLVCMGPYANLLFDIITNKNYADLLVPALLTLPTTMIIPLYWSYYIRNKSQINQILSELDDLD